MISSTNRWVPARNVLACLLSAFLAAPPAWAGTATTWLGGTGNWSDSTQWDTAIVPNNGSTSGLVDVFVPNAGANLTIDVSPFISSLTTGASTTLGLSGQTLGIQSEPGSGLIINNGGTINLTGAQLTLDYSNATASSPALVPSALNSGTIELDAVSTLFLNQGTGSDPLALTGGGSIQLTGSVIAAVAGSEALTTDNNISGNGSIALGALQLTTGSLTASGGTLSVATLGNYDPTNGLTGGSYTANDGAILQLGNGSPGIGANNANITLNGTGQIQSAGVDLLGGILFSNGANGVLTVQNGASLSTGALTNSGAINVGIPNSDTASLTTTGLTNSGTVTVNPGSIFTTGDISSNLNLNGDGSTTLTQGTWNVLGSLVVANAGTGISTIGSGASLTLDAGTGSIGSGGSDAVYGTLARNDGALTLQGGTFNAAGNAFTNNGTLTVSNGATFNAFALANLTPDTGPATTTTLTGGT